MNYWEYKIVLKDKFYASLSQDHADYETDWLNSMGREGWELYNYQNLTGRQDKYCFKRQLN